MTEAWRFSPAAATPGRKALTILLVDDPEETGPTGCGRCGRLTSSAYHARSCPLIGTPPPDPALGRDLRTVEGARQWLAHPANQFDVEIFIVRWDGVVPTLRRTDVERLWEGTSLAEVIVWEQARRRMGRFGAGEPEDAAGG